MVFYICSLNAEMLAYLQEEAAGTGETYLMDRNTNRVLFSERTPLISARIERHGVFFCE